MKDKAFILLVEDEPVLGRIVKENLEAENFQIFWAKDGEKAIKAYQDLKPDLLILDVMLPVKSGFELAKEIRNLDNDTPILFLTAKSQTSDVVEGFKVGGNDYLKKPFSMKELIVRIENLIQRQKKNSIMEVFSIGDYTFDPQRQTLQFRKEKVEQLTHKESQLLFYLYVNKETLMDRSVVLKKLWGDDDFFSKRSMDVFISRLRKKLSQDPRIQIINARGYGYKLVW